MPAIYMNCSRVIHQHKTGQLESFLRFSNQNWGGKDQSLSTGASCKMWNHDMFPQHMEKVVRKEEAGRSRGRWERWRALISVQVQGYRGSEAIWVPVLPTLLWHTRYPSFLPDEFSFAYNSSKWIPVICNQDSCLINIASFLAILSFVKYLFMVFGHFSTGHVLLLIDFYESILQIKPIFPGCHSTQFLLWPLLSELFFFFALSTMLGFFLWLCLKTIRNIHLYFLLECL